MPGKGSTRGPFSLSHSIRTRPELASSPIQTLGQHPGILQTQISQLLEDGAILHLGKALGDFKDSYQ